MRRFKPQMYSSHRQKIFIAILLLFTAKSGAIGEKDKSSTEDSLRFIRIRKNEYMRKILDPKSNYRKHRAVHREKRGVGRYSNRIA